VTAPDRDAIEVEALRTDRYLEALLTAVDRRAPATPTDAALDPEIRDAATSLARQLARIHPSFRFEERLAARLDELARSMRLAPAAGGETVPLQAVPPAGPDTLSDPLGDPLVGPDDAPDLPDLRSYLIGGAITSAAISLAGAAWVAWRRAHPPARSPMARAARAVRASRPSRAPRLPRLVD
jgi:hypothetical protein